VTSLDRPGVLADVTKVISNMGGNITNASVLTTRDKKAVISLEIVVKDLSQLHILLASIEKVDGIISAERSRTVR